MEVACGEQAKKKKQAKKNREIDRQKEEKESKGKSVLDIKHF